MTLQMDAQRFVALVAAAVILSQAACGKEQPQTGPGAGNASAARAPVPEPATPTSGAQADTGERALAGFSPELKQLQIAFITNGPASDWGYNHAHNLGRLALEQAHRGNVKTGILENIAETADAARTMERLIDSGVDMIVATSFGYQDSTIAVASRHPKVAFLQACIFQRLLKGFARQFHRVALADAEDRPGQPFLLAVLDFEDHRFDNTRANVNSCCKCHAATPSTRPSAARRANSAPPSAPV